jgi:hypothetical protein
MKIKLTFKQLSPVNIQFGSCDITFHLTRKDKSYPHHFRFHENKRIYNYQNWSWSMERMKRFCERMEKEYTWDNGYF